MKQRKYLNKYKRSTYENERILCIDVFSDWNNCEVFIITKTQKKGFFVPSSIGLSASILDYSADYILCSLQEKQGISVLK